MAILEDRLSTQVVDAVYVPPEDEIRYSFQEDFEGGPKYVSDTSGGMNFQIWDLVYADPTITLVPRDSGAPYQVLSVAGCKQLSFCFDQNARPSVFYSTQTSSFHYWYDTEVAQFVTTEYPDMVSGHLSLDDKRDTQFSANDILLWYTKEDPVTAGVYYLYHRKQRERFQTEYVMRMDPNTAMPVPPYLLKAGMHAGIRGKVTLTYRTP